MFSLLSKELNLLSNSSSIDSKEHLRATQFKLPLVFSDFSNNILRELKNRINLYKNQSLLSVLKNESRFHLFLKGEIIYVYGTSTSGKSTFSEKLVELMPEYTLVSTRDIKTNYMAKIIREVCPNEYKHVMEFIGIDALLIFLFEEAKTVPPEISNKNEIVNFIRSLECIKSKINLIEKKYNPIEQLHYVYEHVFKLSEENKKLVFDNVDICNFLYYMLLKNIHCPMRVLLLYCPPATLLERVIKRNEIAKNYDLVNMRSPMRPLETFLNIYKNSNDGNYVDQIERTVLLDLFSAAYAECKDIKDKNPLSILSLSEVLDLVNSNFGFESVIKLQSKFRYDLLLDTSKHSSEELVRSVQQKIRL